MATTTTTSSPIFNGNGKLRPLGSSKSLNQPGHALSHRILGQQIAIIPHFVLESGVEMYNVPVAYMTWGKLSVDRSNAMVVCHALSGSADINDWWGPLLGPGKAFDTDKFFIVCMNSLGSPYGTASPLTAKNGNVSEGWYGADFPETTIRDDVQALLNTLSVQKVAAVIGGSMGGMLALEWAYFGIDYVRCVVPVATSAHQSAWGIGWGEAQRHAIYSDAKYKDGRYSLYDPPVGGLEAARMAALLTYRSRDALEVRFGRGTSTMRRLAENKGDSNDKPPCQANEAADSSFAAQSYLRYQAKKFSTRFDSNCYVSLTKKLDSHDVSRTRADTIPEALSQIQQPMLVLGIRSDGLYTLSEQEQIVRHVPNAILREIVSHDGHDAFLIEANQLNWLIMGFLFENLADIMQERQTSEI